MIEYIKGEIVNLTPASVVLETGGMGYFLNISINTYTEIQSQSTCRLYVYEAIREDAYILYGFSRTEEREAFCKLIAVSGIGANTARVILSSLTVSELEAGIMSENIALFKSIKGIGLKTAQRIIVELKDKVAKSGLAASATLPLSGNNEIREESVAALQMLGFQTSASSKVVYSILKENPQMPVEQVIKAALKLL